VIAGAREYRREHPDEARYTDSAATASIDRGLLGTGDDVPAGPLSIRVRIAIAADGVDDARLRELVKWAREHSPVDDAISRAVPVSVEIDTAPVERRRQAP